MFSLFLKYFFCISCSIYTYNKIFNIQLYKRTVLLKYLLFTSIVSIISILFSPYNASLGIIIMVLSTYSFLTIFSQNNPRISFSAIALSFSLSFIYYALAGVLTTIIFLIIYKTAPAIPYIYTDVPTIIFHFLFLYLSLKIKRFKNGISFLVLKNETGAGLFISICFIIFISYVSTNIYDNFIIHFLIAVLAISLPIFIFHYWNYRITQTYKEKLRLANEKSLQDELNRQKQEIATLQADNKRLAKIVHKDNKLIPAMELTVTEFLLNSSNLNADELSALGQELSERLHNMAKDRQGILQSGQKADIALPQSGLHTVDGMLSFMETRAKEEQITYKIQVDENIKSLITDAIQEEDLLHLLGDLIDNAIIAVKHCQSNKEILIHLGTLQNHFLLEISDSGVPFDIESYQRFGNEQHTTHKEDGGSGIGLMDIWKLKKKYKASLQIYEYPPDTSTYAKKISFVFDHKNHFLLQTYRSKEISYTLTRGDLYVFPCKTE